MLSTRLCSCPGPASPIPDDVFGGDGDLHVCGDLPGLSLTADPKGCSGGQVVATRIRGGVWPPRSAPGRASPEPPRQRLPRDTHSPWGGPAGGQGPLPAEPQGHGQPGQGAGWGLAGWHLAQQRRRVGARPLCALPEGLPQPGTWGCPAGRGHPSCGPPTRSPPLHGAPLQGVSPRCPQRDRVAPREESCLFSSREINNIKPSFCTVAVEEKTHFFFQREEVLLLSCSFCTHLWPQNPVRTASRGCRSGTPVPTMFAVFCTCFSSNSITHPSSFRAPRQITF